MPTAAPITPTTLRRGEAKGLGFAVELAKFQTCLGADYAFRGIDADSLHRREVNHQTALADGLAGDAVASASHRYLHIVLPCELHARDHVSRTAAPHDQSGMPVNHRVRNGPRLVVPGLSGAVRQSSQQWPEFLNGGF